VSHARAVDERNPAGSRPLAEGEEEEAAVDANDVPSDVDVEDPTRAEFRGGCRDQERIIARSRDCFALLNAGTNVPAAKQPRAAEISPPRAL